MRRLATLFSLLCWRLLVPLILAPVLSFGGPRSHFVSSTPSLGDLRASGGMSSSDAADSSSLLLSSSELSYRKIIGAGSSSKQFSSFGLSYKKCGDGASVSARFGCLSMSEAWLVAAWLG